MDNEREQMFTAGAEAGTLRAQLDVARRRAEHLRRVIELISGELDLEALLTRIIASAAELTGAGYGAIGLVIEGPDGPRIRTAAMVNLPPAGIGAELGPDEGMLGHILSAQRPVRVTRYADLPQMSATGFDENAVIGVPIWWANRLVGALSVGAPPPHRFSDDDEALLTALARHAAIAVENARLFATERQRRERLTLLNRVARLIASSLSVEELFQQAVDAIRANFGYSYLGVAVVDPDDPAWLVLLAQAGEAPFLLQAGYRHPRAAGLIGAALRAGRPLLVNDVRRDPRYIPVPGAPEVQAELVVPIVVGKRVLGVLNVETRHPIDPDEAESVETVADQFGAALENARLYGETRRALENTRLLYDVSRRLAGAMTVEEVVRAYLEEVAARGRYVCTVALYDSDLPEQRTTVIVQGMWSPAAGLRLEQARFPYGRDLLDGPLDAGETVAIRDVHSDPRCTPLLRAIQAESGRPALAFVPLFARRRRIGAVFLSYGRPHDWPAEELRLYQTTAAQLSSALDSRLQHGLLAERSRELAVFEERRRLARELHDSVTQSLFSLSLLAQVLPNLWELDRPEAERSLEQVRDLTRGALAEMRELLYELRPDEGGNHDLAQALRARAGAFARRSGLFVKLNGPTSLRLSADVVHALMRIAQEALTNIDHHASAAQVWLELRTGPPIVLRISDNGRGFDPAGVPAGRLGLVSMYERAEAIGATLTVSSAPGQGTEVMVRWPAESKAEG